MTDLILHHYDVSPYAEKIRTVLGIKNLTWRSVIVPSAMPKPDLMPLTGGYRRTPVLQIGADIYCDTQLMATLLERLHPNPSIFPDGNPGLQMALGSWANGPYVVPSLPARNHAGSICMPCGTRGFCCDSHQERRNARMDAFQK